ncbi:hypothetical protein OKW40_006355 [Paraburkholderia sp. RAU6.4a]|uniref:hypothetical protein n=1 Tax=Paraburkholderia sp. RAU6.4a TaxID=2991067 RepID=UPI003D207905
MSSGYRVKAIVLTSGERLPILLDMDGHPTPPLGTPPPGSSPPSLALLPFRLAQAGNQPITSRMPERTATLKPAKHALRTSMHLIPIAVPTHTA